MGILLDKAGPGTLCVIGGLLQSLGLLLIGMAQGDAESSLDLFFVAFVMSAIGGTALMQQSLKLAFLLPTHFALIMSLTNCFVDSSSVVPLLFYRLYVMGFSRQVIFTAFALLCLLSSLLLAWSWHGARLSQPKSSSAAPRLQGLPFSKQLGSMEFLFALIFMSTMVFRMNTYVTVIKELLEGLGDALHQNWYTQVLSMVLPSAILFAPLFELCLRRGGFAVTFSLVTLLGCTWNLVTLIPSLQWQPLGFLSFTYFRGLLFSSITTFTAHSFGNSFGRVYSVLLCVTGILSLAVWPATELSRQWTGGLYALNLFLLALCLL